jgi:hypothetical protein
MLSKIETDKILSIEVACQVVIEKCRQLRIEAAPLSISGKKSQKQLVQNSIEKYYAKRRARALKKQINSSNKKASPENR